jgi:hypothetical protein
MRLHVRLTCDSAGREYMFVTAQNMDNVRCYIHQFHYVGVLIRSSFGGVCEHVDSLLTANKNR